MSALRAAMLVCVLVGLPAGTAGAAVSIETVPVGNPGNVGELSGAGAGGYGPDRICGAVPYAYQIGKYEVTAGQYTEFLNAVARTDPYGLYNPYMASTIDACMIVRAGTPGDYHYSVAPDRANRPVNHVTFWSAARFCNWMQNGQGNTGTETGAYTLNGYNGSVGGSIARNPNAIWALPTEDEWYKAAYYKGGGTNAGYWDFATQSDTPPIAEPPPGGAEPPGSANYLFAVDAPYYTNEVGAYTLSPSHYGTFDQTGNIDEWTETLVDGNAPVVRDGAFGAGIPWIRATYRGNYVNPNGFGSLVGFRVAYVPEPATLALLASGALAAMSRRRRGGKA